MSAFLHFLLNAFIILGSLGGCLAAVLLVVFNTRGWTERLIRGLAIFAGTLMVMGAQAAGLPFSSFAVNSASQGGAVGWVIRIVWVVLGASAGALLARFLVSRMNGGTNLQIRLIILVTIIAHVELLEIYAQNLSKHGFVLGSGALPNIAFLSGLVLYVILRYDTGEVQSIRDHLPGHSSSAWLGRGGRRGYERPEPQSVPADPFPHLFGEQPEQPERRREPDPWV